MAVVYAPRRAGACHMQATCTWSTGLTIPEAGIFPGGRFKTRGKSAMWPGYRTGGLSTTAHYVLLVTHGPVLVKLLSEAPGWRRHYLVAANRERIFD